MLRRVIVVVVVIVVIVVVVVEYVLEYAGKRYLRGYYYVVCYCYCGICFRGYEVCYCC